MRVDDPGEGRLVMEERERSRWRRSIWRWRATAVLALIYTVCLHSWYAAEQSKFQLGLYDEIMTHLQADAPLQFDAVVKERLQPLLEAADQRIHAIDQRLARCTKLSWALQTPDVERDMALQTALEDLERRIK